MSTMSRVRLTTPGQIVASVPLLCGFYPANSLVVISLRLEGERKMVGLTARLDLPETPADLGNVLSQIPVRMSQDGASDVLLVVFSDKADVWDGLVTDLRVALATHSIGIQEAMRTANGLWWSYDCHLPCCPPEGTPVPTDDDQVNTVKAAGVGQGRGVLPTREDLVRSVQAGPNTMTAEEIKVVGLAPFGGGESAWEQALADWKDKPRDLHPYLAATLARQLHLTYNRDHVMTYILDDDALMLSLALAVAQQTPDELAAPVCTMVALAAYASGDGALANVGLDRALACTGDYSLALLVRRCLDSGFPPVVIRELLQSTRDELS